MNTLSGCSSHPCPPAIDAGAASSCLLDVRDVHRHYRQLRRSLLTPPRNTHALKVSVFVSITVRVWLW